MSFNSLKNHVDVYILVSRKLVNDKYQGKRHSFKFAQRALDIV